MPRFYTSTPRRNLSSLPLIYFHRFYRLVPPIVFLTLINQFILYYLGGGPLWPANMRGATENCKKYWWTNFLFIADFHPGPTAMCLGHLW